jgi:voltage-gated potassium channel
MMRNLREMLADAGVSLRRGPRSFIYELLHRADGEIALTRWVRMSIELLIVVNVAVVILETVDHIHAAYAKTFLIVDLVSVSIFAVEYLLRLWSVVEDERYRHPLFGRLRWMVTPAAIIDLVAILPILLHILPVDDLRIVRALRLLRLERLLLLGRHSRSLQTVISAMRRMRRELYASIVVIGLMLLVSSSLMYYVEHEAQPEHFPNIPHALWWGVITLTSVGYGDVYPITPVGKVFGGLIAMLGIFIVAIPSGLICTGFIDEMQNGRLCPHCGRDIGKHPDESKDHPAAE